MQARIGRRGGGDPRDARPPTGDGSRYGIGRGYAREQFLGAIRGDFPEDSTGNEFRTQGVKPTCCGRASTTQLFIALRQQTQHSHMIGPLHHAKEVRASPRSRPNSRRSHRSCSTGPKPTRAPEPTTSPAHPQCSPARQAAAQQKTEPVRLRSPNVITEPRRPAEQLIDLPRRGHLSRPSSPRQHRPRPQYATACADQHQSSLPSTTLPNIVDEDHGGHS